MFLQDLSKKKQLISLVCTRVIKIRNTKLIKLTEFYVKVILTQALMWTTNHLFIYQPTTR